MEGLVRAGLVRSLGVSNFSARKLQALMAHAAIPPAVCQVRRRGLAGWLAVEGPERIAGASASEQGGCVAAVSKLCVHPRAPPIDVSFEQPLARLHNSRPNLPLPLVPCML